MAVEGQQSYQQEFSTDTLEKDTHITEAQKFLNMLLSIDPNKSFLPLDQVLSDLYGDTSSTSHDRLTETVHATEQLLIDSGILGLKITPVSNAGNRADDFNTYGFRLDATTARELDNRNVNSSRSHDEADGVDSSSSDVKKTKSRLPSSTHSSIEMPMFVNPELKGYLEINAGKEEEDIVLDTSFLANIIRLNEFMILHKSIVAGFNIPMITKESVSYADKVASSCLDKNHNSDQVWPLGEEAVARLDAVYFFYRHINNNLIVNSDGELDEQFSRAIGEVWEISPEDYGLMFVVARNDCMKLGYTFID